MGQQHTRLAEKYELVNQGENDLRSFLSEEHLSDDFVITNIAPMESEATKPAGQNEAFDDESASPGSEGEDGAPSCPDTTSLIENNISSRRNGSIRHYDEGVSVETVRIQKETLMSITVEIFLPFLVAGFGMVAAGVVLDIVQHWKVFVEVNELFILVPALLGLKGNLEMTLASRLSTQAHLGNMDSRPKAISIVSSNLALIQVQAIVVGLIASAFAILVDWLPEQTINFSHGILLCAASVVTASIASFALGMVMVVVILTSRRFGINPDNVATPIAASLGDLVTLLLLSSIASKLYADKEDGWLAPLLIAIYVLFVPVCIFLTARNEETTKVLKSGWTPVLIAMSISSMGGLILDKAVTKFKGIAVFQPVFNGVGGNLVAVQASRISTYLHSSDSPLGVLPKNEEPGVCLNPCSVVCSTSNVHSRTCRVLLAIAIPGHFLFAFTISFLKAGHTSTTATFYTFYLMAAFLQIWILLCVAHWMILWMWRFHIDPDNASIPYLTALGDLLGGGFLAATFELLFIIGDRDSDVGD